MRVILAILGAIVGLSLASSSHEMFGIFLGAFAGFAAAEFGALRSRLRALEGELAELRKAQAAVRQPRRRGAQREPRASRCATAGARPDAQHGPCGRVRAASNLPSINRRRRNPRSRAAAVRPTSPAVQRVQHRLNQRVDPWEPLQGGVAVGRCSAAPGGLRGHSGPRAAASISSAVTRWCASASSSFSSA